MTHADLIERLGNTREVAKALGRSDSAVSNWKTDGIPWKWRPTIAAMAEEAGIPVPPDFLKAVP